jgi:DnaJ-class molecular chaperone
MMRDPWIILGVSPGTSAQQIHAAWRKGVSRWHPDRNPSPEATLKLQEINDAYASICRGAPAQAWSNAPASVLAGLSGTVFGESCVPGRLPPDCVRVSVDIPALNWVLDQPVTLAIPLAANVTTIMTLLHPGQLRNGSTLVFRGAGFSATRTTTDLLLTLRVALPAMEPPARGSLRRRMVRCAGADAGPVQAVRIRQTLAKCSNGTMKSPVCRQQKYKARLCTR